MFVKSFEEVAVHFVIVPMWFKYSNTLTPVNISPLDTLLIIFWRHLADCYAMTVLSPSCVTYAEKSLIACGSPDHAEYPAPPTDYRILRIPSIEN